MLLFLLECLGLLKLVLGLLFLLIPEALQHSSAELWGFGSLQLLKL